MENRNDLPERVQAACARVRMIDAMEAVHAIAGLDLAGGSASMIMQRMTTPNPYAADLLNREPLEAFADTPFRLKTLVEGWDEADFERTYAPGKWPMRKVLIHLAQTELALSTRARHALADDRYAAASFSQDDWLIVESGLDARTALDVYTTLRRMNVAMFRALSPAQLDRAFSHPEYGSLTVRWVLAQMAGHDIHHLKQFEEVAAN